MTPHTVVVLENTVYTNISDPKKHSPSRCKMGRCQHKKKSPNPPSTMPLQGRSGERLRRHRGTPLGSVISNSSSMPPTQHWQFSGTWVRSLLSQLTRRQSLCLHGTGAMTWLCCCLQSLRVTVGLLQKPAVWALLHYLPMRLWERRIHTLQLLDFLCWMHTGTRWVIG